MAIPVIPGTPSSLSHSPSDLDASQWLYSSLYSPTTRAAAWIRDDSNVLGMPNLSSCWMTRRENHNTSHWIFNTLIILCSHTVLLFYSHMWHQHFYCYSDQYVQLKHSFDKKNCEMWVYLERRHAIVANERVGEDQQLIFVGRIRQGLSVADHSSLKHCWGEMW